MKNPPDISSGGLIVSRRTLRKSENRDHLKIRRIS